MTARRSRWVARGAERATATGSAPVRAALAGAVGLSVVACAPGFESPAQVESLRQLATEKDKPYGKPDESLTATLYWTDGARDAALLATPAPAVTPPERPIIRGFVGPCYNPEGDLFYDCFDEIAATLAALSSTTADIVVEPGDSAGSYCVSPATAADGAEGLKFCVGDRVTFDVPSSDEVIVREGSSGRPDYGLAVLFTFTCAGSLPFGDDAVIPAVSAEASDGGFPILCYDEAGQPVTQDDFVLGYTSIYLYDELENQNPTFADPLDAALVFAGVSYEPDCVGDACVDAPYPSRDDVRCANEADDGRRVVPCVAPCAGADPLVDCPGYLTAPSIERLEERDPLSGEDLYEQVWVRYLTNGGRLGSEIRLVSDASTGWQDDYTTEVYAPAEQGLLLFWAIVQDNRGGVAVLRQTIIVR